MRQRSAIVRVLLSYPFLGAAFLIVHAGLAALNLQQQPGQMLGDVTIVYRDWMDRWLTDGRMVGIDLPWVYPTLALVPMLLAEAFGRDQYGQTWLILVTAANAVALIVLARRSRTVALWWIGFTALLGPIALSRIDAPALALAIPAVVVISTRPAVASALLTLGAWIKIWPAAMLIALAISSRLPRRIVLTACGISAGIVLVALALGSGSNVISSITAQTGRGLQIEAPAALPWMWLAHFAPSVAGTYWDSGISTFQVVGPATHGAAAMMNPVLAVGVIAIVALAVRARRRSDDLQMVLATTSIALVTTLILLNKVGSPQYVSWLAAPAVLGLLTDAKRFRTPAVLTLFIAGSTQLVYPWLYASVISQAAPLLLVMTVRAVLEVALIGFAVRRLVKLGSSMVVSNSPGAGPGVHAARAVPVTTG